MIATSELELGAMRKCLRWFGQAAAEIGFSKPLGDYSEAEALQVIDAIVTGYTEAMVAHHEATKFPPVRGMGLTSDPLSEPVTASDATALIDMADDLPWVQVEPTTRRARP